MRKIKKSNTVNKKVIIFALLDIVCIVVICLFGFDVFKTDVPVDNNLGNDEVISDGVEEKVYEASLIGVGDNLIHSSVYRDANRHLPKNVEQTIDISLQPAGVYRILLEICGECFIGEFIKND